VLTAADFRWDRYWWTTTLDLPGWDGGAARVVVAPEGQRGDAPLTPAELGSVQWLADHGAAATAAVLGALLAAYPGIKEEFAEFVEPDVMPDVESVDDLRPLLRLVTVCVHDVFAGDVPYLGFELECFWDEEHGAGVLLHGTRVVRVGGADTAIMRWMATDDAAAG
jgi:hypothetical protein